MRDGSNGEIRFIIRDLEKFWIFTEITILPFFRKMEFSRVSQIFFIEFICICEGIKSQIDASAKEIEVIEARLNDLR